MQHRRPEPTGQPFSLPAVSQPAGVKGSVHQRSVAEMRYVARSGVLRRRGPVGDHVRVAGAAADAIPCT